MTDKFDTQELCGRLDPTRKFNMNTCSGLPVWPADPRPEDIRIEDIAGALSRVCRFNGHLKDDVVVKQPAYDPKVHGQCWCVHSEANKPYEYHVPVEIYSVAQHSVLVEQKVRKTLNISSDYGDTVPVDCAPLLLAALLHDAHEYILGDMVKPQKKMYSSRSEYETKWDKAIAERFGFDVSLFDHPAIERADYRIFLTEKRDLLVSKDTDFGVAKAEPYPEQIIPVLPSAARKMFMERFNELYKGE